MLKSKIPYGRLAVGMVFQFMLIGCGVGVETSTEPAESDTSEDTTTEDVAASETVGELEIRANGEDFVRQGFTTKDGWQIEFNHVYVNLADVTAYQSDPPFDAEAGGLPEAEQIVSLDESQTVDLAAGEDDADPILVEAVEAPAGRYNALSWKMMPATDGPAAGQTIQMEGTATQADDSVDFVIKLDPTLGFVCGDFVGDDRKGILEADNKADVEATFHFDHVFGDGEAPPDDDINTGALGFDPLAAIAQDGSLNVNMDDLQSQLSAEDYDTLMAILPSLGHVGEGHCAETELTVSL